MASPLHPEVTVPITDGEAIVRRENRELSIVVATDEVTITHALCPAGELVAGPHVHHEHTDAFYVLEGELTFEIGRKAKTITVSTGGCRRRAAGGSSLAPQRQRPHRARTQHPRARRRLRSVHARHPRRRRCRVGYLSRAPRRRSARGRRDRPIVRLPSALAKSILSKQKAATALPCAPLTSMPSAPTPSRIAWAQRIARAGPSKVAKNPSPAVSTLAPGTVRAAHARLSDVAPRAPARRCHRVLRPWWWIRLDR